MHYLTYFDKIILVNLSMALVSKDIAVGTRFISLKLTVNYFFAKIFLTEAISVGKYLMNFEVYPYDSNDKLSL